MNVEWLSETAKHRWRWENCTRPKAFTSEENLLTVDLLLCFRIIWYRFIEMSIFIEKRNNECYSTVSASTYFSGRNNGLMCAVTKTKPTPTVHSARVYIYLRLPLKETAACSLFTLCFIALPTLNELVGHKQVTKVRIVDMKVETVN